MSNDAKEWVTVKVPREVRDDASDDPRTYGDIMRDGLGESPESVRGISDALAEDEVAIIGSESAITHEIAERLEKATEGEGLPDDLREQLDRIESAAATAEERTGQIQGTLDGMGEW